MPAKDMRADYRLAAYNILGIPAQTAPPVFPFIQKGECCLTTENLLPDWAERSVQSAALSSLSGIPDEWRLYLARHIAVCYLSDRTMMAFLDVRKAAQLLALLPEKEYQAIPKEKLTAFCALRPCFSPALRPGLSMIVRFRPDGSMESFQLCPRLLEGYEDAPHGFYYPVAMNLELTTQCPLRCPQCYCHLEAGKHMPLETAARWLRQAGSLGVHTVNLSGGETMCYPQIYEVIQLARQNCNEADIALSGYGITEDTLDRLLAAGTSGIYISLNGPTKETNAPTRDGYELAIHTLKLLQQRGFSRTYLNWVMHDSNADTLPQMVRLAEQYQVQGIMVMAFKPDSSHSLPSLPTAAQMRATADFIRQYNGPLEIEAETCFSSMRALLGKSFWGNRNVGPFRGCGAGRDSFSVAWDGRLSPCRHLEYWEQRDSLWDYWNTSSTLEQLRWIDASPCAPCNSCELSQWCRHCMAINAKMNGGLYRGDSTCPLQPIEKEAAPWL